MAQLRTAGRAAAAPINNQGPRAIGSWSRPPPSSRSSPVITAAANPAVKRNKRTDGRAEPGATGDHRAQLDVAVTGAAEHGHDVHELAHAVPEAVSAILTLVAVTIWMLTVDWRLAVAAAVVVPAGFLNRPKSVNCGH